MTRVAVYLLQLLQLNVEDGEVISSDQDFISIDSVDILDYVPHAFGSLYDCSLEVLLPFLVLVTRACEPEDFHWRRAETFEENSRD